MQTEVMGALLRLFARELISQRTKEGLAASRARGQLLGRPKEVPRWFIDTLRVKEDSVMDYKMVETMRDLVTQIGWMMETAFSEESDVIEKLHQLLGELAAVGASLQDTAIQKKNLDGLTLSEMFLMQNVTQLLYAANDFSIYLRAASLTERGRGDLGPTARDMHLEPGLGILITSRFRCTMGEFLWLA
jgi:hypothetical protein